MAYEDEIERMVTLAMRRWTAAKAARRDRSQAWRARHDRLRRDTDEQKHPRNQKCGALTRRGIRCIRPGLKNGRCRNHGGLSSGPKSSEGRARIAEAQRLRWARWKSSPSRETSHKISEKVDD